MTITKFEHACVRISDGDRRLVVDPGGFTGAEAMEGAQAVLITHVHFDHYSIEHLQATDTPVFTIAEVARQIEDEDPAVRERGECHRTRPDVRRRRVLGHGGR